MEGEGFHIEIPETVISIKFNHVPMQMLFIFSCRSIFKTIIKNRLTR